MQSSMDLGPIPYEPPRYMSPSSIGTFQQCPMKFKFSRLDRLPTESTEAQHLGSFVHEVLEDLFALPAEERTESAARSIARWQWNMKWNEKFNELAEKGTENEFRWKAWWCIENYFGMEDPTSFEAAGIEAKMDGAIDGVPIFGIIDRWTLENDKLVISDYKTGKKPRPQYEWEKKMQITIYSILLAEQEEREVERAELLYLKSGEFARYEIDAELESAVRVEVSNTWDKVTTSCASGEFQTITGPLCNWCDYKSICPEWSNV